jgi:hypothetical protein
MSGEDAATRLAAMQAELVRTLAGQAGTPRGFDYTRLEATAEALRKKRATAVARLWPGLACGLGDRYPHRFAAFAAQTPLPCAGGALADGRAFARWLARAGELSEQGRLETLAVELRYTHKGGVLVRRRGPALLMAALSNPRRLVLFFRLPWIGERWLSLRLWDRQPLRLCAAGSQPGNDVGQLSSIPRLIALENIYVPISSGAFGPLDPGGACPAGRAEHRAPISGERPGGSRPRPQPIDVHR